MKATFISTTNPRFEYLEGTEGILTITRSAYFTHGFEYIERFFQTSRFKTIEYQYIVTDDTAIVKCLITMRTLNSTYVFRVDV